MGGKKGYTHQDEGYFEKSSDDGSNKEYIVPVGNMQNQSQVLMMKVAGLVYKTY